MTAFVLGMPDDVRGFALAGIPGCACTTAEQLRGVGATLDPAEVGLLLVSSSVRSLSPEIFDELRRRFDLKLVVLP